MPVTRLLAVLTVLFFSALCGGQTINLDSAAVGSVPSGWTVAMTHAGGAPKWEVRRLSLPGGPPAGGELPLLPIMKNAIP